LSVHRHGVLAAEVDGNMNTAPGVFLCGFLRPCSDQARDEVLLGQVDDDRAVRGRWSVAGLATNLVSSDEIEASSGCSDLAAEGVGITSRDFKWSGRPLGEDYRS
jgi:hypothetical protein